MKFFKYNFDDIDWPVKHCLNKMLFSYSFLQKMNDLSEGECGGEIDWHLLKWNEEVSSDFGVDKYEGYMAYLGNEEHGYSEEDVTCIISNKELGNYIIKAIEYYKHDNECTLENLKLLEECIIKINKAD